MKSLTKLKQLKNKLQSRKKWLDNIKIKEDISR